MQYCIYCGKELKCTCSGGQSLGSSSVSCPLKKATIWVHVTDDGGADVEGVDIVCRGTNSSTDLTGHTDPRGLASWGPLDIPPEEYTISLQPLSSTVAKKNVLPALPVRTRTVKVAPGELTYAPFELLRWGKVKVVVKFAKGSNPVDVDVKLGLKEKSGGDVGTDTGRAGKIFDAPPGEYVVLASLPGAPGAHHITADKSKDVTVASNAEAPVTIQIETVEVTIAEQDQTLDIVASGKTPQELTLHADVFPAPPGTLEWTAVPADAIEIVPDNTPVGSRYSAKIKPLKPGEVTVTAKYTNGGVASNTSKVKVRVLPIVEIAAPQVVAIRNATGATHPRIEVKVGTTAPFDGTAKLTATHTGGMAVYDAAAAGNELILPADISNALLTGGKPLYLEAATKSTGRKTTVLKLELVGGTVPFGDAVVDSMTAVALTLEMYRDTTTLTVAPFYATDEAALFDAPLPDAMQNVTAPTRPGTQDAAFLFPDKTVYATNAAADQDDRVVRFRVKPDPDPSPDELTPAEFEAVIKVLNAAGTAIAMGMPAAPTGTAMHAAGMKVKLQRQPGAPEWVSPYGRVFTIAFKTRSLVDTHFIIHSLNNRGANLADGLQFQRVLRISAKVGAADLSADFRLGGQPYARVPVRFLWVSDTTPAAQAQTTMAFNKLHALNQYWAGQGVEFVPDEPATPIRTVKAPSRTQITLGEFTGADNIADHDISVVVHLQATPGGGGPQPIALPPCNIAANQNMSNAALDLQAAIQTWAGAGALAGLSLTATIHELPDARAHLQFDLHLGAHDLSTGLLKTTLPVLGTRGPIDIEIQGAGLALDDLTITRIDVLDGGGLADPAVDFFCPPSKNAVHDPFIMPPSAAFRQWVRTFSPAGKNYATVVIVTAAHANIDQGLDKLCEQGFCGLWDADNGVMQGRFSAPMRGTVGGPPAQTLLNPGVWTDTHARMICLIRDTSFNMGSDDVQHEIGHALTALNHTINDPDWFYAGELLHTSSGKPSNNTTRQTIQRIYVFSAIKEGVCKAAYVQLDHGYGGAVRAWLATNEPGWLVNALDPTQPAW